MRTEFITGVAGSGKTYTIKERISQDSSYGQLSASTGIAAVNLDTITIHSLLGFFDLDSLKDAYTSGKLNKNIKKVATEGYKNIIIDEVSMFGSESLDIIHRAISEVNHMEGVDLGLILSGDFLQLPAIKSPFAFEANCWPSFEANTLKLTKIWRQNDQSFINALNHARSGNGASCIDLLTSDCGITLESKLRSDFPGTTIVAKNDQVDRFNWLSLSNIKSPLITSEKIERGKPTTDWKRIPERAEFKIGAYVMLLSNQYGGFDVGKKEIEFANGDCGFVRDYSDGTFIVELVRNGKEVQVSPITRYNSQRHKPDPQAFEEIEARYNFTPYRKVISEELIWVIGELTYLPMRLAYCSTVHKTQGLTLDRVQCDFRDHFFGSPAMMYVALSRCRTAEGLRLVGGKDLFVKRCKIDEKVRRFA